jgi:CP family cyanate transporter-like MFS transporter
MQVFGIIGSLLVPALIAWAGRRGHDQRVLGLVVGVAWVVPLLGLLVAPQLWPAWVVVIGLGQGAGISLGFALMVLRAADDHVAAGLSGFVQTGGYLLAAGTPVLVGAVYDASGGWQLPLLVLAALATALGLSGLVAGARRTIGESA